MTIGVLGLAYKENTHSVKNSPALKLISQLQGFKIQAYDPLVKTIPFESPSLTIRPTCLDVVKESDILFLMTPWDEFKALSPEAFLPLMNKKFVVDPYKLLSMDTNVAFAKDIIYYSLC
jgi:UDPglucose 6-dehydrogenase